MILGGAQETVQRWKESFVEGMRQGGQIEGRTFMLQLRYSSGEAARNAALVKEAVAERPDVLVVVGLTAARNARDATSTIPVVVASSSDLVDAGIVATLARPGGNITGVSDLADETAVKRLELLKAVLPKASRVVLLNNPDFPATPKIEARVEGAAPALGVAITRLYARDRASLVAAIDGLAQSRPDALLIGGDALFVVNSRELIERATALRVPVVHYWPGTAEQGAILSHQTDIAENFRRAGGYVDKILRGAKPGELPIYQPTRYELIVNAKAARALGLTIPQSLLLRADEVIQ
jgi:putative ABC transport system substrate-binding protein